MQFVFATKFITLSILVGLEWVFNKHLLNESDS